MIFECAVGGLDLGLGNLDEKSHLGTRWLLFLSELLSTYCVIVPCLAYSKALLCSLIMESEKDSSSPLFSA